SRHCARDVGAEQHASADVESDLCLERNSSAELFEELFDSGDCGFDFEDVLRCLDEEEVDASFYKVLCLVVEILRELVEGDVAEFVAESPFSKSSWCALEGAGFYDIDSDFEK